jgi:RNA polymerase sigma-70 factor, ECF subfamily
VTPLLLLRLRRSVRPGGLVAEFAQEREIVRDLELARRAAGGETGAFEVLVWRYQRLMFGLCRRITCDDHDAVDALQEALLAVWRRIGTFEGRSALSTWLFRVAANAAIDEVRRRSPGIQSADLAGADPADPYDVETSAVAKSTVDWAMAMLPPPFRAGNWIGP